MGFEYSFKIFVENFNKILSQIDEINKKVNSLGQEGGAGGAAPDTGGLRTILSFIDSAVKSGTTLRELFASMFTSFQKGNKIQPTVDQLSTLKSEAVSTRTAIDSILKAIDKASPGELATVGDVLKLLQTQGFASSQQIQGISASTLGLKVNIGEVRKELQFMSNDYDKLVGEVRNYTTANREALDAADKGAKTTRKTVSTKKEISPAEVDVSGTRPAFVAVDALIKKAKELEVALLKALQVKPSGELSESLAQVNKISDAASNLKNKLQDVKVGFDRGDIEVFDKLQPTIANTEKASNNLNKQLDQIIEKHKNINAELETEKVKTEQVTEATKKQKPEKQVTPTEVASKGIPVGPEVKLPEKGALTAVIPPDLEKNLESLRNKFGDIKIAVGDTRKYINALGKDKIPEDAIQGFRTSLNNVTGDIRKVQQEINKLTPQALAGDPGAVEKIVSLISQAVGKTNAWQASVKSVQDSINQTLAAQQQVVSAEASTQSSAQGATDALNSQAEAAQKAADASTKGAQAQGDAASSAKNVAGAQKDAQAATEKTAEATKKSSDSQKQQAGETKKTNEELIREFNLVEQVFRKAVELTRALNASGKAPKQLEDALNRINAELMQMVGFTKAGGSAFSDKAGKDMMGQTDAVANAWQSARSQINAFNSEAGKTKAIISGVKPPDEWGPRPPDTENLKGFNKNMEIAIEKIIRYRVAFYAMRAVIDGVKGAFQEFIDVQYKLAQIAQVTDPITTNLQTMKKEAVSMSQVFGVSIKEVIDSYKVWAQMGLAQSDILDATRAALLGVNTTGLDAKEVVDALTSALFTYRMEASELTRVIDKWAKVQAAFPVEAKDLVQALQTIGNAAMEVGVDIDELNGYVTAINAVTRKSGNAIGNSLKTMFARIQRPAIINDLRSLNVAALEDKDTIRDLTDIFYDLAMSWDTLTDRQQRNIAVQVGGIRHYVDFVALMENYDVALKATADSQLASMDAVSKQETIMNTIKKSFDVAKASVEAFSLALGEKLAPIAKAAAAAMKAMGDTFSSSGWVTFITYLMKLVSVFILWKGIVFVSTLAYNQLFKAIVKSTSATLGETWAVLGLSRANKEMWAMLWADITGFVKKTAATIADTFATTKGTFATISFTLAQRGLITALYGTAMALKTMIASLGPMALLWIGLEFVISKFSSVTDDATIGQQQLSVSVQENSEALVSETKGLYNTNNALKLMQSQRETILKQMSQTVEGTKAHNDLQGKLVDVNKKLASGYPALIGYMKDYNDETSNVNQGIESLIKNNLDLAEINSKIWESQADIFSKTAKTDLSNVEKSKNALEKVMASFPTDLTLAGDIGSGFLGGLFANIESYKREMSDLSKSEQKINIEATLENLLPIPTREQINEYFLTLTSEQKAEAEKNYDKVRKVYMDAATKLFYSKIPGQEQKFMDWFEKEVLPFTGRGQLVGDALKNVGDTFALLFSGMTKESRDFVSAYQGLMGEFAPKLTDAWIKIGKIKAGEEYYKNNPFQGMLEAAKRGTQELADIMAGKGGEITDSVRSLKQKFEEALTQAHLEDIINKHIKDLKFQGKMNIELVAQAEGYKDVYDEMQSLYQTLLDEQARLKDEIEENSKIEIETGEGDVGTREKKKLDLETSLATVDKMILTYHNTMSRLAEDYYNIAIATNAVLQDKARILELTDKYHANEIKRLELEADFIQGVNSMRINGLKDIYKIFESLSGYQEENLSLEKQSIDNSYALREAALARSGSLERINELEKEVYKVEQQQGKSRIQILAEQGTGYEAIQKKMDEMNRLQSSYDQQKSDNEKQYMKDRMAYTQKLYDYENRRLIEQAKLQVRLINEVADGISSAISGNIASFPDLMMEGAQNRKRLTKEIKDTEQQIYDLQKNGIQNESDARSLQESQQKLKDLKKELKGYAQVWYEIRSVIFGIFEDVGKTIHKALSQKVAESIVNITLKGKPLGEQIAESIVGSADEYSKRLYTAFSKSTEEFLKSYGDIFEASIKRYTDSADKIVSTMNSLNETGKELQVEIGRQGKIPGESKGFIGPIPELKEKDVTQNFRTEPSLPGPTSQPSGDFKQAETAVNTASMQVQSTLMSLDAVIMSLSMLLETTQLPENTRQAAEELLAKCKQAGQAISNGAKNAGTTENKGSKSFGKNMLEIAKNFGSLLAADIGMALGTRAGGGGPNAAYGANLGSSMLGAVGGSISALGAFGGPLGMFAGGILGGIIGGIFDKQEEVAQQQVYSVQENTSAVQANTNALEQLTEQIFNAPTRFALPAYGGGFPTMGGGFNGNVIFNIDGRGSNPKEIADSIRTMLNNDLRIGMKTSQTKSYIFGD